MKTNVYMKMLAAMFLLLLGACASQPPVRSEYDRQADFSDYHTYTWINVDPVNTPNGRTPEISALTLSRIVDAIEDELDRKGYERAERDQRPDFAIAFTVGTRDRIIVDSYPAAYRGSWPWRPTYWDYDVMARTYQEGMLGIDIFDEYSHRPVWHGFTYKRITEHMRDDPEPEIREAVRAVLSRFPPR